MRLPLEHWGATPEEISRPMPGDDLIPDAPMSATRAIDLDCPPAAAFGWLTQMGFGKAGWYSYDLIDNLGRRSATTIRPEWQVIEPGQPVPGGPVDFTAAIIDEPRAFVVSLLGQRLAAHRIDFTLAFELNPGAAPPMAGDAGTRLVSRARANIDGPIGRVAVPMLCVGDGIMVRRQLIGIRSRCSA